MTDTEQRLRIRIEELEEEVRQLRETLTPFTCFPFVTGGTVKTRILASLSARPGMYMSYSRLNITSDECLKVHVCKLRKLLKPFGIHIYTSYHNGYMMDAESARKLMAFASPPVDENFLQFQ